MKTKKVKSAGRFRAGHGSYVRSKITAIEGKQRKKQLCPLCKKGRAERTSKGIWECNKCGKKFAAHAYYLNK